MFRYIATALVLGALALTAVPRADAQVMPVQTQAAQGPSLVGTYVNVSSGGIAYVYRSGRGYQFVDENGLPAWFLNTTTSRLDMVAGEWIPTVVTVVRAGFGRTLLRFDAAGVTGYWRQIG
jgi:hypothetical protein